jgi:exodeoxyribonuclease III
MSINLSPFKIVTWNINGLRAVAKKGLLEWIDEFQPDVLGLQETKCTVEQAHEVLASYLEDYQLIGAEALKKGYSGTALLVKKKWPLKQAHAEISLEEFDQEGRTNWVQIGDLLIVNSYYPNGSRDHSRVPYKLSYSNAIVEFALKKQKQENVSILLMGDFNTAHHPIDLANPESNKKTTGFLIEERAFLDHCQKLGLSDLMRHYHPDESGLYTWWTYRQGCRERNIGWRIDYHWADQAVLKHSKACYHLPEVLGSDHCPVVLELDPSIFNF